MIKTTHYYAAALLCVLSLVVPMVAGAQVGVPPAQPPPTPADLQALIQALLAQIAALQAQLAQQQGGGGVVPFCHTFTTYLIIGSQGDEVSALQKILANYGYSIPDGEQSTATFGEGTAAAVVKYQTTQGITATGSVGPITRAALNAQYGCKTIPPPPTGQPNLAISPTDLTVGQTYTFTGKLTNAAPNSAVYLYIQRSNGSLKLDHYYVGATNENGVLTAQTNQSITGGQGLYRAWVLVGNQRSNEVYFNLSGSTAGYDLSISSVYFTANGLSATFCNNGAAVSSFPVDININGVVRHSDFSGLYQANTCMSHSFTFGVWGITYQPGVEYNAAISVDPFNAISETNELNNLVTAKIAGTPAALQVTSPAAGERWTIGSTNVVRWNTDSHGEGSHDAYLLTGFCSYVKLDDVLNGTVQSCRQVARIFQDFGKASVYWDKVEPSVSNGVYGPATYPVPGSYYMGIKDRGYFDASRKGETAISSLFSMVAPPSADLAVDSITATQVPVGDSRGPGVVVTAKVVNIGGVTSPTFRAEIYVDKATTDSLPTYLELAPQQATKVTSFIPNGSRSAGYHSVQFFLRPNGDDYQPNNNTNYTSYYIPPSAVAAPTLISPLSGAVLDNGRTDRQDDVIWDFDWSDIAGATAYHLTVVADGANPVVDTTSLTQSSYHYDSPGTYITNLNQFNWYWKVSALVNGSWTPWSEARRFSVEPVDTDPPTTGTATLTVSPGAQLQPILASQGARLLPFTRVKFTAGNGGDVVINSLTVEKTGSMSDAALESVLIRPDITGNSYTVPQPLNSNHQVIFSLPIKIPAGTSLEMEIQGIMACDLRSYVGQVGFLSLVAIQSSATVSGSLPITGVGNTVNASLSPESHCFPPLAVISPNGNETFSSGSTIQIQWKGGTNDLRVALELFNEAYTTSYTIISDTANDGVESWVIPSYVPQGRYFVRVDCLHCTADPSGSVPFDDGGVFSIVGTTPTPTYNTYFITPVGGETLTPGQTYKIAWGIQPAYAGTTQATLYAVGDTGANVIIATLPAKQGYYSWTVPGINQLPISTSGKYSILLNLSISDLAPNSASITKQVTITGPPSTYNTYFLAPSASASLSPGQPYKITWGIQPAYSGATVISLYVKGDGAQETLIASNVLARQGYYNWTVSSPLPPSIFGKYSVEMNVPMSDLFPGGARLFSAPFIIGPSPAPPPLGAVTSGAQVANTLQSIGEVLQALKQLLPAAP